MKTPVTRSRARAWFIPVGAAIFLLLCASMLSAQDRGTPRAPQPKLRFIRANGIKIRIAEMGKGPLVILVHGWPESWYSWRHQIPALAAAGYRVVAPDMRGYGKTDKPGAVEDYDIQHLTGDLRGIVEALGEKSAALIGHDWGAIVAWQAMLLHPRQFTSLVAMSVPYNGRPGQSIVQSLRQAQGDNFYYILYFQEPGVAEREFDADPRGILSRLYLSPDSPREAPQITDPKRAAGGWIPRLGAPKGLPAWLTQADLDYYVREFTAAGFRGGINYYRNFHRNWETTPQLAGVKINAPVLFLAGEKDTVIRGRNAEALTSAMRDAVPGLREVKLIPGKGHWVQQEAPAEINEAIISFLRTAHGGAAR
ncbi:MAG: alpha/beta fold hydrolase [Blastocatellia bacterium]